MSSPARIAAPAAEAVIEVDRLVAGHDPAVLLAEHGSPLYVYDAAALRSRRSCVQS